MSDFGHFHINAPQVHIDAWGVGPFVISAGGKQFRFEARMVELEGICTAARREMVRLRLGFFSCVTAALVLGIGCFWLEVQQYPAVALNISLSLGVLALVGGGATLFLHSQAHERGRKAAYEMQALLISFGKDEE